ncbi:MAG TPA: triose-phosphate isomerase [Alphaproteobacteria bacterium]
MKKLIAGNWKMNTSKEDAAALAQELAKGFGQGLPNADMVICPPHVWLGLVTDQLKNSALQLGAQDCHNAEKGAFTGNISAIMLKEIGAKYVIVGHSERRQYHGETNELVKQKAEAALAQGLIPIVCVGETEAERTAGDQEKVVGQQLTESLPDNGKIVVAYEPVWAIGTGKTATNDDVANMHKFMRAHITKQVSGGDKIPLLYGGSVKSSNAKDILHLPDVDGVLVGGASLQAPEFLAIAQAA